MKGNTYISLTESTYQGAIPTELMAQYGRKDDYGNLITTTFEQVAKDTEQMYGAVLPVEYLNQTYYLLELDCSWKNGEMSALLNLGEGMDFPNNTLLTINETIALLTLTYETPENEPE